MKLFSKGPKVLVADDEEVVRLLLKKYLEKKNFRVVLAPDGIVAKELIEKEPFDCFLLDCSMPGLTGLELIQSARLRNPKSKIVLISGYPSVDDDVTRRLGGDLFLHKPILLSQLDRIFGTDRERTDK